MPFELNDERVIDILIFWVTGADGSVDYEENKSIDDMLDELGYDPSTYYAKTLNHISSLGVDSINALIEEAKTYAAENFSKDRQRLILQLLEQIASSDDDITKEEERCLNELKEQFDL